MGGAWELVVKSVGLAGCEPPVRTTWCSIEFSLSQQICGRAGRPRAQTIAYNSWGGAMLKKIKEIRKAVLVGTLLSSGWSSVIHAQTSHDFQLRDENGVDLVYGDVALRFEEGAVGSGRARLALVRGGGGISLEYEHISLSARSMGADTSDKIVEVTVSFPEGSEAFKKYNNGPFVDQNAGGATLTEERYGYRYRSSQGGEIIFANPNSSTAPVSPSICSYQLGQNCLFYPIQIAKPNGDKISFNYDVHPYTPNQYSSRYIPPQHKVRLASIANNYGYSVRFEYTEKYSSSSTPPSANWRRKKYARFYRQLDSVGQIAYSYPSNGAPDGPVDITDMSGQTWHLDYSGITPPGASQPSLSVESISASETKVTRDGVTTRYNRSVSGNTATMVVTQVLAPNETREMTVVSDLSRGRPTKIKNWDGGETIYSYDAFKRVNRITYPTGNYTEYLLDARGNATQTTQGPKEGSSELPMVSRATYPANCDNSITCNKPTTTTDPSRQVTQYEYHPQNGGITKITLPSGDNGVAPQTRYTYALENNIWQLKSISTCRSQPSCTDTGDETRTSYAYDAYGNLVSQTIGAGDGSLSATTSMEYNALGDPISVDGPLTGSGDTTFFRYDGARRRTGVIAPDPDGSGPLPRRAQRLSYDASGRLTQSEIGTVMAADDSGWAGFSSQMQSSNIFENGRIIRHTTTAGGTIQSVTQTSYDVLGRTECTALRMNPSAFGSLPTACSLGPTGSHGPDRITRFTYDKASRVWQRQAAVGTADQTYDAIMTYTQSGQVKTAADGEGNLTTYEYDGFDRPWRTRFPVSAKGAQTSSAADYEQVTYDETGKVREKKLRDGSIVTYSYDRLGRITRQDRPNLGENADISYNYDSVGNVTSATGNWGGSFTFAYDALGRLLSEQQPWTGTLSWAYDAAGRRTRTTWADGFFVDYEYRSTGELATITEQGGFVLASFGYDGLGRRSSLTRGNGTVTSYGYDAASRLSSLTQDLAGSGQDMTVSFAYNPAGQIASRTLSNDAYAWSGHYNVDRSYGVNGLNQLTSAGTTPLGYDLRGNLTSSGSTNYAYTAGNKLFQSPAGTMVYDPVERLFHIGAENSLLRYEGGQQIVEQDATSGAVRKRYVYGDGPDEVLVQYDGSSTGTRRWLHADERGSIVAVSDAGGAALAINTYDEYGIPGVGNQGRFQYTGQAWIPSLGLYHYKARMYSPTLGRFLQTDPIGYGDGFNWYDYVGGDPVNGIDPSGMNCAGRNGKTYCDRAYPDDDAPAITVNGRRYFMPSVLWDRDDRWKCENGGVLAGGRCRSSKEMMEEFMKWQSLIAKAMAEAAFAKNIPCKDGANCKVTWPCNISNNYCGPKPSPVYKQRLFGTHWCGPGGEGPTTGKLDEACRSHDMCYGANGLSVSSNFNPFPNAALRECNQRLCDASRGTGTAGFLVREYFRNAPPNPYNACGG